MKKDILGITEYKIPILKMASIENAMTRLQRPLFYRHYFSFSEKLVIILHGVASDSKYLTSLALQIAQQNKAHVVTPDLLGHGEYQRLKLFEQDLSLKEPQLVIQDLEELIIHLKFKFSIKEIILVGHSFGAAIAMKWSLLAPDLFHHLFLLAPFFGEKVPIHSNDLGGWISKNQFQKITVNYPLELLTGCEVLKYEQKLFDYYSMTTIEFENLLRNHFVDIYIGEDDPLYDINKVKQYFSSRMNNSDFKMNFQSIPHINHYGIVMDRKIIHDIVEKF